MSAWNHPICERCWIDGNTVAETPDVPAHIRRPSLLKDPVLEVCCFCGMETIFGCYVRSEPMDTCVHVEDQSA